jgi:hypothetical protein
VQGDDRPRRESDPDRRKAGAVVGHVAEPEADVARRLGILAAIIAPSPIGLTTRPRPATTASPSSSSKRRMSDASSVPVRVRERVVEEDDRAMARSPAMRAVDRGCGRELIRHWRSRRAITIFWRLFGDLRSSVWLA